ncbi:PKD domain-containing protein, partial [uncultured Mucilaginibacter sp.]|uniref:PKD domain-containing protein n=1 Tax=uncultured Mucilaginibacter sp. TaxID=797541 RepID=UPI0025E13069
SYFWNYGGGIPSTDTTVNGKTSYVINYGYGNYTVSLKVTTDSGCFGIKTRHINILPSPHAGYSDSANNSIYPYILCAGSGSSLQLTDTSSAIGGSPITQRFWKFNGVVNANHTPNIQYSFPNQGEYDIQLEVVNALGCADSTTQTINVHAPFVAEFTYSDHCLGDYTTFTDVTNSFSIVSRTWKFRENGDGPYAYTPIANFRFNQANTYDVELQVQNAIGCIARLDQQVKIVQKPVANFTGLIGCENHYYRPLDSSIVLNDTIASYAWNIGNVQYNVKNPSILFTDTGALNVKLTIKTDEGCVDSVQKLIEVGPVPTALFSFTPLYGTAPLAVTFNNRSTGASNYFWNFGDGSSTTSGIPSINPAPHTYLQNGNYRVVLYAYNNYGCYDSLARTLNIIPTDLDLAIDYITTKAVPQSDGSQLVTLIAYISNLGTRVITSAQLYATLGSRGVMEQNWSGFLASGQTIVDTFPAQFVVPEGYGNTYVCVTASDVNGGEAELNYDNNQECSSLTGTMQLAGPLPNPAVTSSQLGIIMPAAGTVYISMYDLLGQPVVKEFSMHLPAGRTNYNIPMAQLMSAEYFIRVRYNDDTEVRNFVVR